MLKSISIENIAVIEKAEIEFSKGLNVLTGETGAGKSIVVDSINAILGERTSKELVRSGCENANVTAYFQDINDDVKQKLIEYDIPLEEDNSLLLSRKITNQGKSTCRINGVMSTVGMLKELGSLLVNIHGQHDSQALLNPDYHYKFVDMYGNIGDLLEEYRTSFRNFLSVRKKLKSLTLDADERDKEIELLDYQIKELTSAEIRDGEWEELKKRKNIILSSQNIINSLNSTLSAINGGEDYSGILGLVSSSINETNSISNIDDELKDISNQLEDINDKVEILKDSIEKKLSTIDFGADELEKIEERLDLLYSFSNKYGQTEKDMLYYLENAIEKRKLFDNSEEELEKLNLEYDRAYKETSDLAKKLSEKRKHSSKKLGEEICKQLEFLDMPKIKFSTSFDEGNLSINGEDKIEFLISTNIGEPPKPLAKIASGGELSRIMLAIKSIIAKNDSVGTLIFDEIDTGVSGKASRKIGLKLKEVGASTQVICVTHSAQIASIADTHFLIEKEYSNSRTFTKVSPLNFEERKRELARIMGGLEITDALLLSAEEMLDDNEIIIV